MVEVKSICGGDDMGLIQRSLLLLIILHIPVGIFPTKGIIMKCLKYILASIFIYNAKLLELLQEENYFFLFYSNRFVMMKTLCLFS